MPKPHPPPTPGSSSDLRGRESTQNAPVFHLPPAAYDQPYDRESTASIASSTQGGSDSSYQPVSPTSPTNVAAKKRTPTQTGPVVARDDLSLLPPPPTRARKIIQMKPRANEHRQPTPPIPPQTADVTSPQPAPRSTGTGQTGSKRKQANAGTTAAGRKIARKTAHSLIERRRRSKMNEEFGVLKDMIPACRGQEMHKLAILQASIEYLRYLEQCVSDLQTQSNGVSGIPPPPASLTSRSDRVEEEEEDEDEEMEDDHEPAPHHVERTRLMQRSGSLVSLPPLSQITSTTSPSVFSANGSRHFSISSAASQPSYSPLYPSNQTSPAFGPQLYPLAQMMPGFGLGSPALAPQDSHLRQIAESATERAEKLTRAAPSSSSSSSIHVPPTLAKPPPSEHRTEHELDQEATAALLMLNHDRRNWRQESDMTSRSATGMSVKDLLSG